MNFINAVCYLNLWWITHTLTPNPNTNPNPNLFGWLVFMSDFQDIWKVLCSSQRILCQLRITYITLILPIESGIMIATFLLYMHFHLSHFACSFLPPFYISTMMCWHCYISLPCVLKPQNCIPDWSTLPGMKYTLQKCLQRIC